MVKARDSDFSATRVSLGGYLGVEVSDFVALSELRYRSHDLSVLLWNDTHIVSLSMRDDPQLILNTLITLYFPLFYHIRAFYLSQIAEY